MNKNYPDNSQESLERSHSVKSNAKLTLICFFGIIAFSLLWVSLALKDVISTSLFVIAVIASAALTFLALLMFNKFKR